MSNKLSADLLLKIGITDAQLELARRMECRIRKLDEEINLLVNDPVNKAMQQCSCEEIDALLEVLPGGFHRTELRAWRLKKFGRPGVPELAAGNPA